MTQNEAMKSWQNQRERAQATETHFHFRIFSMFFLLSWQMQSCLFWQHWPESGKLELRQLVLPSGEHVEPRLWRQ